MAFIARSNRKMWFGTEERMGWVPVPLSGADASPVGWSAGGTLLNGGAYQHNSFNMAKNYTYSWPPSSSVEAAQKMQSYAQGTYGRGLLYFIDPLTYGTNILPAMWADPSMGIGFEGSALVSGLTPTKVPGRGVDGEPVYGAQYTLSATPVGFRGVKEAVFLPIPEGFTLYLGADYTTTGSNAVFYVPQTTSGARGNPVAVPPLAAGVEVNTFIHSGVAAGVWLYLGRSSSASTVASIYHMTARLIPTANAVAGDPLLKSIQTDPWVGGQGHSGCRFNGRPTYIEHSGVNGGQVEYAATFTEVGSWVYG